MILLGHMLADLVEAETGLQVDRRFNLGGTLVCYNALKRGGLDAYVEYTGTALTTILKEPPDNDPQPGARARPRRSWRGATGSLPRPARLREHVRAADAPGRRPSGSASARSPTSRATQATIRPGFGPEFMNRPDGYPGLVRAYGLNFAHTPARWTATCSTRPWRRARSTWPRATRPTAGSPRSTWSSSRTTAAISPPIEAVPLVREETLRRLPQPRARPRPARGQDRRGDDAAAELRGRRQAPRPGRGGARVPQVARGSIAKARAG